MRSRDRVAIGSITKVFTAVLTMQLVERNELSLPETMSAIASRYGRDGGRFRQLVDAYDDRLGRVTVRELLDMTSGIRDYQSTAALHHALISAPRRRRSLEQVARWGLNRPPAFTPGTPGRALYSSTNYALLGMILEAVNGRPLAAQMRTLFHRAGLRHTSYQPPLGGERSSKVARGYIPDPFPPEDRSDDREYRAFIRSEPGRPLYAPSARLRLAPPTPLIDAASGARSRTLRRPTLWTYRQASGSYDLSIASAAGGIVSTQEDLVRFWRALTAGRLLSRKTVARMESFAGPKGNQFGLGLIPIRVPAGGLYRGSPRLVLWGHAGEIWGYDSFSYYLQGSGTIISYTINASPSVTLNNGFVERLLVAALRRRS